MIREKHSFFTPRVLSIILSPSLCFSNGCVHDLDKESKKQSDENAQSDERIDEERNWADAAKLQPDPHIKRMILSRQPLNSEALRGGIPYFEEEIPRNIHQIWFGNEEQMDEQKPALWRKYARTFNHNYRLWTDKDLPEIESALPARSQVALRALLKVKNFWASSDIVRINLLNNYGGTYADIDIGPPIIEHEMIDLGSVLPKRNLVFIGEHAPRNVGVGSLFVGNSFIMSMACHPLLKHMENIMVDNMESVIGTTVTEDTEDFVGAMYMTGPFFISRNLAGVFNVVPMQYLISLNMVD